MSIENERNQESENGSRRVNRRQMKPFITVARQDVAREEATRYASRNHTDLIGRNRLGAPQSRPQPVVPLCCGRISFFLQDKEKRQTNQHTDRIYRVCVLASRCCIGSGPSFTGRDWQFAAIQSASRT